MNTTTPTVLPRSATSKPIYASTTIWGVVITAICGILSTLDVQITDAETQSMGEAVGILVGCILAIVGRYKARKTLTLPSVPALTSTAKVLAIAFLMGVACSTTLLQTACTSVSASVKTVFKEAARGALKVGLAVVVAQVPALAPFEAALSESIDKVFAKYGDDPQATGRAIAAELEAIVQDKELRAEVLGAYRAALVSDGATASGPGATYNADLAEAL